MTNLHGTHRANPLRIVQHNSSLPNNLATALHSFPAAQSCAEISPDVAPHRLVPILRLHGAEGFLDDRREVCVGDAIEPKERFDARVEDLVREKSVNVHNSTSKVPDTFLVGSHANVIHVLRNNVSGE